MEVQDTELDHALLRRVLELLPADKVLLRYAAEQVLAGVPLEVALASMSPEQRLADVPPSSASQIWTAITRRSRCPSRSCS
jgi:hypothetical protein